MSKRNMIIGAGILALAVGWYAFRPELLFIDRIVDEEFPAVQPWLSIENRPAVVSKEEFKSLAHDPKGQAALYQLPDGRRTLRLTQFETSNGPDVNVYLIAADIEKGKDAVKEGGFIDPGSMKGNKEDQNHNITENVELNKYQSVSIWCARFGVNFGTAALTPGAAMPLN